eukprot:g8593.t1
MFGLAPRSKSATRQQGKAPSAAGKDGDSIVVGRRVRLHPKGILGVVRWVGPTHFSAGVWVGVELDSCEGKNDGEVQGSRYFTCAAGHGVFVRPESVTSAKGEGLATPSREHRRRPSLGGTEATPMSRKGSHTSLASENFGPSSIPTSAWGPGSESGGVRKTPNKTRRVPAGDSGAGSDDQIIGRILASEAFSRVLSATVADRVRTEVANREAQTKADIEAMLNRMCELEQMVDDAGGAMDDIASMVQTISESVEGGAPSQPDSSDAAAGGGGGGGDAGGGGRDDARVAELTKLLCTVHDMSSQAAELLRSERKQHQVQMRYLTERVRELEVKHRNGSPSPTPMEG